jgi:hypothetical protein
MMESDIKLMEFTDPNALGNWEFKTSPPLDLFSHEKRKTDTTHKQIEIINK